MPSDVQGGWANKNGVSASTQSGGDEAVRGKLENGEGASQGGECCSFIWLPRGIEGGKRIGEGRSQTDEEKADAINRPFKFKGRLPKWQISPDVVLSAFVDFVESHSFIDKILTSIKTGRNEREVVYTSQELIWTIVLFFMMRFSSRNNYDQFRNSRAFSETVLNFAGRKYNADNPRLFTACSQTWVNMLANMPTTHEGELSELEQAQVALVRHLLRGKWLASARIKGYYCIAVDATVKDRKFARNQTFEKASHKNRYVLEAKIITPWGWALTVVSEDIEPYDSEKEKQDAESKGFVRLAEKLRKALPGYALCIIGDSLYQCMPVVSLCDKNHWQYIFTAKEGRAPTLYKTFQDEISDHSNQSGSIEDSWTKETLKLAWAHGSNAGYEVDYDVPFNFVDLLALNQARETKYYKGAFITSFEIKDVKDAAMITRFGRMRWNIENSFKTLKHDGFGLEHTFCLNDNASRNLHLLMTISATLWQVFSSCALCKERNQSRKVTDKMLAEKLRMGILSIGYTEKLVVCVKRMSRSYKDQWGVKRDASLNVS